MALHKFLRKVKTVSRQKISEHKTVERGEEREGGGKEDGGWRRETER